MNDPRQQIDDDPGDCHRPPMNWRGAKWIVSEARMLGHWWLVDPPMVVVANVNASSTAVPVIRPT